jgi:hypothetical protein
MDAAQLCVKRAQESAVASGCNWYVLTPLLRACIEKATAGCAEQERTSWVEVVSTYNKTLQAGECYYAPCGNQTARVDQMLSCYTRFGSMEDVIVGITFESSVTSEDPACLTLSSLGTCLVEATVGCPALIDLTYVHINGVIGADVAYAVCGLTPYVTAIGNAQRALFGAVSVMPSDEYDTPADTVTPTPEGSGVGHIVIIFLGCIVIASTMAVTVTITVLAVRKRRNSHRQSIMQDWRPNGQKIIFMDDPHIFPPANQSPRQSGFRPQTYTNLDGILNQAAAVQ